MEQTNIIVLENNEEYNEISDMIYEGNKYVLLSNVSNPKDICVRKVVIDNTREYICRLDDSEFKAVFNRLIENSEDVLNGNN